MTAGGCLISPRLPRFLIYDVFVSPLGRLKHSVYDPRRRLCCADISPLCRVLEPREVTLVGFWL